VISTLTGVVVMTADAEIRMVEIVSLCSDTKTHQRSLALTTTFGVWWSGQSRGVLEGSVSSLTVKPQGLKLLRRTISPDGKPRATLLPQSPVAVVRRLSSLSLTACPIQTATELAS